MVYFLVFQISIASFLDLAPMPTKCSLPSAANQFEQSTLAPPFHSHTKAGEPQKGQGFTSSLLILTPPHAIMTWFAIAFSILSSAIPMYRRVVVGLECCRRC